MSALAAPAGAARERRRYRREVEGLLEQIRAGTQRLRLQRAGGVRAVALAEQKRELAEARARLAALLASAE